VYGTPAADSAGVVTVLEPAASRMAALVTGFSFSLDPDELDVEEDFDVDEDDGLDELDEGDDDEDCPSAFTFSRSLRAFIFANFSLSSADPVAFELEDSVDDLTLEDELEALFDPLELIEELPVAADDVSIAVAGVTEGG